MSAREKLLTQFRQLVAERLGRVGTALMELENGPNPEASKAALRDLHGLKGEARMMGFAEINSLVHEMEELVRAAQGGGYGLSGNSIDALLVVSDAVTVLSGGASGAAPDVPKLIDWLKQRTAAEVAAHGGASAPSPPPSAPAPAAAPAPAPAAPAPLEPSHEITPQRSSTERAAADVARSMASEGTGSGVRRAERLESIRIEHESLDVITSAVTDLMQLSRRRELAASKRLQLSRELAQIHRLTEDLGPEAAPITARLARAKELAAELHREGKLLASEELRDLTQLTEEVQAIRMLPVSVLFEQYPRMVRDLARELGKEVELTIEGEDTKADRMVVEALRDPLMHLVRNALDHGLEAKDQRQRIGKSGKGQLALRASREGDRIVLRVEDDGAGIDPAKMRQVAVRRGVMSEAEAAALGDEAARDLVFLSGFSSRDVASDLSGRGVGLDVVRVRVQELGGDVSLTSHLERGTAFEVRVPVSLTVAPLLFVQVGDEQLCLTAAHVTNAIKVEHDQLREMGGRPALRVNDEVLPFASISSILGMAPERPASEGELVLLVSGQSFRAAISVDRVLEERVQAILPLRGVLSRFKHLTGATPLANGSLALVLSATHLITSARGTASLRIQAPAPRASETKRRRIMVVDDSPLTRELISSLLETVGYEIINAADGLEALDRLSRDRVDMVVTDLEMPRMDGLELTRSLKAHSTLRSLPVVIVTTRGADADRRKGMEAGADGYIAKGDLVRQDLVDVVARLLG